MYIRSHANAYTPHAPVRHTSNVIAIEFTQRIILIVWPIAVVSTYDARRTLYSIILYNERHTYYHSLMPHIRIGAFHAHVLMN